MSSEPSDNLPDTPHSPTFIQGKYPLAQDHSMESAIRIVTVTAFLLCFLLGTYLHAQNRSRLRLWYDQPAVNWNEALPIGNGRLAAMVFGEPAREQIQLNEETVWAGGPNNNIKPDAFPIIQHTRQLLFSGKYLEAQQLVDSSLTPHGNSGMPYQPVGNVSIIFPEHKTYSYYNRDLDLQNATAAFSTLQQKPFEHSNGFFAARKTETRLPGNLVRYVCDKIVTRFRINTQSV